MGDDTLRYDIFIDHFAFRERNGFEGQEYGLSSGTFLGHLEMTAVSWASDKGSWDLVGVKLREQIN